MGSESNRFAPCGRRLLLGFVLAPLIASGAPFALITLAILLRDPAGFVHQQHDSIIGSAIFIALVGAYPMTLVFGVPLFLLLIPFAARIGYGPIAPVLVGFTTAFAGTVALQAMDHTVHADGYLMAAGVGLDGAFGGFVFWLLAVGLDPRWRALRRRPPLTICFEDQSAGRFERGKPPTRAGRYAYMPFRSLPHLRMVEAVHAGSRPRCSCRIGPDLVSFVVVALPRPHRMIVDEIERRRIPNGDPGSTEPNLRIP